MKPSSPRPKDPAAPGADVGPALHPVAPEQLGSADTGLPGLRSWGAVYAVVAGVFVLWLVLLLAFMRAYS
jgi:hypothetical protein